MKKIFAFCVFILLFCLVTGCSSWEQPAADGVTGYQGSLTEGVSGKPDPEDVTGKPVAERITEFKRLAPDGTLASFVPEGAFTASDEGDIFLSENFEKISRYTMDGTLVKSYENGKNAEALCLMGDGLFFYTTDDELKRLSLGDGTVETVVGELHASFLQNLAAAGGKLYALLDEDDRRYIKEIDPETGSMETVEVEDGLVRAIYASTDGKLYYCLDTGGECFLYSYQPENWKSTLEYKLTNQLFPGTTVNCFVYEQGLFAYASPEKKIHVLSLEEENSTETVLDGAVAMGRDMACASGNLVCRVYTEEKSLYTLYLGEVKFPEAPQEGTVKVRTFMDRLAAETIERSSGIRTKIMKGDIYTDEFLAEVMAGNPEIDLFLLPINTVIAQKMKEKGIYEPLNSSAKISKYQDDCFPYIAGEMETGEGELWMLPIGVSGDCIWYSEENMDKFQISTSDFQTMESFLQLFRTVKEQIAGTEYRIYVETPYKFGSSMGDQYDTFYCDFLHGKADYQTEVYQDFFEQMWSGWVVKSQNSCPSYLACSLQEHDTDLHKYHPVYNPKRTIFKWSSMADHLSLGTMDGWRVCQSPRLTNEIHENEVSLVGFIVNPYGKQKELAVDYLEVITEQPMGVFTEGYWNLMPFVFQNIGRYEGTYDITLPVMKDIYEIFKNGKLIAPSYPYGMEIVDDYQQGRLTLEEAIERVQRETEMWLNE